MDEKKSSTIGALWLNTDKRGQKYMSGNVEIDGVKHDIIVFKNSYKDSEKKPDYVIKPKEKRQENSSVRAARAVFEDEVPF